MGSRITFGMWLSFRVGLIGQLDTGEGVPIELRRNRQACSFFLFAFVFGMRCTPYWCPQSFELQSLRRGNTLSSKEPNQAGTGLTWAELIDRLLACPEAE
jgi:hypothetical protein